MKGWKRVDARNPCVVCGKKSWCGVAPDGALLCMRSNTPPSGYVIVPYKKSGTLFRPKEDSRMSKYKVSPANERQYLGRTFGSKAEMEYCKMLEDSVKTGSIMDYICQPRVWLGVPENVYVPDFFVIPHPSIGMGWYVDVKGVETAKFKKDKKLWAAYGRGKLKIVKRQGSGFKEVEVINAAPSR